MVIHRVAVECEFCEKEFYAWPSEQRKFCCVDCSRRSRIIKENYRDFFKLVTELKRDKKNLAQIQHILQPKSRSEAQIITNVYYGKIY